jgi:deazaflavin-dependent oxidoreductase (nitroreductase family)
MVGTGAQDHHHRIGCGPPHPVGQGESVVPLPRWLAQVNKRVFNRIEIKRGVRPVLIHVGRVSGTTYRTPLDAHPVADGYLFIPMYGPRTDWVKNVLATGTAILRIDGDDIALAFPRLVKKDVAWQLLPATTKTPPGISGESELLRMDIRRNT